METRRSARKKMRLDHGKHQVSEDRLSNLPEPLLHEIISRLPSRSVACMSTLSKKWEYLLQSFLGLFFDEREFEYTNDRKNDRRLCQFMSKYSSCQTPILIQKIRIGTTLPRLSKINHQVDRCLDLVLPGEIRELNLKFRHSHRVRQTRCRCYTVPDKMFSLGVNLTILELESCRLGDLVVANFPLLKTISMKYVHISNNTFCNLVDACPSLECMVLHCCFGLRRFRVHNPSLERLVVNYFKEFEVFSIDCPLLQYLECKAKDIYEPGSNLEFSNFEISCAILRVINFTRVTLGAKTINHIFSASPHVISLSLTSCKIEGTLKVHPRELKHLSLEDTYSPQLVGGLSTVESFSLAKNNCRDWSIFDNVYSNYEILCSTLSKFVHLKSLILHGDVLPSDESLEFVISMCCHLSNLHLIYCRYLRHLRIISETLKTLAITSSIDVLVLECEIDAPNLIFFKFVGSPLQLSRVVASHELEVELQLREYDEFSSPLRVSRLEHYVWLFNKARKLTVSNHSTKCILLPDEVMDPSLFYRGQVKASVTLGKTRYIEFLTELLRMSYCRTSLSLNFELGDLPLFGDPSAMLDLKFYDDSRRGVITEHGQNHDCVRDHLYEIGVQILKEPTHVTELLKFLLSKASALKKLTILINGELHSKLRSKIASRITTMKKASPNFEIILC